MTQPHGLHISGMRRIPRKQAGQTRRCHTSTRLGIRLGSTFIELCVGLSHVRRVRAGDYRRALFLSCGARRALGAAVVRRRAPHRARARSRNSLRCLANLPWGRSGPARISRIGCSRTPAAMSASGYTRTQTPHQNDGGFHLLSRHSSPLCAFSASNFKPRHYLRPDGLGGLAYI
jgi:hypothetical protein